jgi:hypothetical protein
MSADPGSRIPAIAGSLAVGLAGGALCSWLAVPLPWMIGPLCALALFQFSGTRFEAPPFARDAGQLVVALALGLYFTPPVAREVSAYGLHFVALGFAAIAAGGVCSLVLARLARVDRATAWFSSMPGGAADMANVGAAHGALTDRVALAHSLRMLVVVTTVPVGLTLAGFAGSDDYVPAMAAFDLGGFALLVAAGALAGLGARRLGLPNPFMIAPLAASIALTVGGISLSSVPTVVSNAAQLLLACSLGTHFRRSFLSEAPRFVVAQLAAVALILVLGAGIGAALAWASGAYLGSALLAAAPGAIAEMSITAKVLRVGVAFVTAAHVVRYVVVVVFGAPIYRLFARPGKV